jgi:hypothetical protein
VVGTEGLILQEQMLIAVVQSLLAYAVAMSAMSSARLAQRRHAEERRKERRAISSALIGSALECASYAAWLAALQRFGLKWYRRPLPESPAQRGFTIEGWKLMLISATAVSKNVELVRHEASDLLPLALKLSNSVNEAMRTASEGRIGELEATGQRIRERADEFRSAASEAPSLSADCACRVPAEKSLARESGTSFERR